MDPSIAVLSPRPLFGRTRARSGAASLLSIALLITMTGLFSACGELQEPEFIETTELIPLPPHLSSYKAANQLGSDLHHSLLMLVERNPERFPPNEVDFKVNWGQMRHMETGESLFFIKVVARSVVPIEESQAAQALMHHGINTAFYLIETEETYVSR